MKILPIIFAVAALAVSNVLSYNRARSAERREQAWEDQAKTQKAMADWWKREWERECSAHVKTVTGAQSQLPTVPPGSMILKWLEENQAKDGTFPTGNGHIILQEIR